jgi:peptidoglycan/LPS O-acetylase OafA/YrhL
MTTPGIKNKRDSWIKGLDSIRFVLALIVFLRHLEDPFRNYLLVSPHHALRICGMLLGVSFNGVGAVMAFFIISGFVIHYPNKEKYPETMPFLIRRWLRVGIPLIVISGIAGIFHQFSVIPIWSLYCELIYYTLYPILLRMKGSWFNKFLVSFILSAVLISLLAPGDWSSLFHRRNINYSGAYWQLGDFLTWIIGLPCWLLGVILAQNIDSSRNKISTGHAWSFRLLVLAGGIALDILKYHFFVSYLFTMNLFAIGLYFWIRNEILYFKTRQPSNMLEFAGKFSYSLYLCHNVFVFFIVMLIPLNMYSYFPIILLTLFSSYLFYRLVEKPSHQLSIKIARQFQGRKLAIN